MWAILAVSLWYFSQGKLGMESEPYTAKQIRLVTGLFIVLTILAYMVPLDYADYASYFVHFLALLVCIRLFLDRKEMKRENSRQE